MKIDYVEALDKFRRVSKLKKEIDKRPNIKRGAKAASARAGAGGAAAGTKMAPANAPRPFVRPHVTAQQLSLEEAKLLRVEESIRIFVRVADPKFRGVVPMRFFNLTLTPAEVDAYIGDYSQESGTRAEVARLLLRNVAVMARMHTELEEMRRCQPATSLWKLRADSLVVLLDVARAAYDGSKKLEQSADVQTSMQKLRHLAEVVVKALAA
jgi:hypothetical protein